MLLGLNRLCNPVELYYYPNEGTSLSTHKLALQLSSVTWIGTAFGCRDMNGQTQKIPISTPAGRG